MTIEMMHPHNRLWAVFWVSCALIAAALVPRAWALRLLYTDADTRQRTRLAMEIVAKREGWILSDVQLREVRWSGLRIIHRQHTRGMDPETCYNFGFTDLVLRPCDS
jgi:hypothetical protein